MSKITGARYEKIKQLVADTIIDADIRDYPFNVFEVAKSLEIEIKSYQSQSDKKCNECFKQSDDGFTVLAEYSTHSKWIIYYNENMSEQRIRFTVMHEIGHIVLNHSESSDVTEKEANFFAKYILTPPCILHVLCLKDCVEIMERFNVSMQVATNALNYYHNWMSFGCQFYTDYEEVILNNISVSGIA